tara:strand:- start:252 stop:797 length:546 start_codon:yes stop_codon:yes gene_type:complete
MASLKNYTYIKDLLSKDEVELLWQYGVNVHRRFDNLDKEHDEYQTSLGETCKYGDPLMDGVLILKKEKIEKELGKELLPTYTYWRMYNQYSELEKHTDREACEYTVSITIKQDMEWPLFIGKNKVYIESGDGVLYQGTKIEHWREEYEGDYAMQLFLHYVLKDGKFADEALDRRQSLGVRK